MERNVYWLHSGCSFFSSIAMSQQSHNVCAGSGDYVFCFGRSLLTQANQTKKKTCVSFDSFACTKLREREKDAIWSCSFRTFCASSSGLWSNDFTFAAAYVFHFQRNMNAMDFFYFWFSICISSNIFFQCFALFASFSGVEHREFMKMQPTICCVVERLINIWCAAAAVVREV